MEKRLLDFLNGKVNVVQLNAMITREQLPNGWQYITIKQFGDEAVLYGFWYNPGNAAAKEKPPPKHTGGKKPYIMLMIEEVEKLREHGVSGVEELIGYIVCLGSYIEWNTGRLIKKRSKKPLKYVDLQNIYKCGNKKLNKMLSEMKEHDLLFSTGEGYFISTKFIKKGKTKNKEAVRDGL